MDAAVRQKQKALEKAVDKRKNVEGPRYDPGKKVPRYFAGKIPEYTKHLLEEPDKEPPTPKEERESEEESDEGQEDDLFANDLTAELGLRKRRRLEDEESQPLPVLQNLREGDIVNAEELFPEDDDEMDLADQELDEDRRQQLLREKRKQDEEALEASFLLQVGDRAAASEASRSDSSSSSESEGEDIVIEKPVYKKKNERSQNYMDEDARQQIQELEELEEENLLEEKRVQTGQLVERVVAEQAEAEQLSQERAELGFQDVISDPENLPDDEISDEDQEYQEWQKRELGRLARDYKEKLAREQEEAEKLRRQKLTEEELEAENRALREAAAKKKAKQGSMKFMQKYYHKGAFFQNVVEAGEEEAFKKDFNVAVGDDRIDKTLLPKVMQVRGSDFGKKSRSKYTHLADQDTTDFTSPWAVGGGRKKRDDRKQAPRPLIPQKRSA